MQSRYNRINETAGKAHQTSAIRQSDIGRIATATSYILAHYIDCVEWTAPIIRKGSLTLQHQLDPHKVIKIFVDYGAELFGTIGFGIGHPSDNPVAIGIELTTMGPFEREVVRDALATDFRFYADPRKPGFAKRWLKPIEDHRYDIIFLEPGHCEDIDSESVESIVRQLEKELPFASEDEFWNLDAIIVGSPGHAGAERLEQSDQSGRSVNDQTIEPVRIPSQVTRHLRDHAPVYGVGQCNGRQASYDDGEVEYAAGYKCVLIYVQNGLAEYSDLFKEVARGVFDVQSRNGRKWPLVVFGFGNSTSLQHEGKYFDFGYIGDAFNKDKVAATIARVSGSSACSPAIVPAFYPRADIRGLYSGKTGIDREDLLIFIGREGEVFLSESLRERVTTSLQKQVLMVEIGAEAVQFAARKMTYEFK